MKAVDQMRCTLYGEFDDTPILNKFQKILQDETGQDWTHDAALTLSWTEFKKKAEESYVVVATGEPTPHGSIILEAGVAGGGGDDDYDDWMIPIPRLG